MNQPDGRYDLLLKGGRVIDPAQGLDGVHDVAVSGGRIAALGPSFDAALDDSLVGTLSKLMAPGFDLPFVVRATTQHPAGALRMADEIGSLRVGTRADVTVLDLVEEPWDFHDCTGETVRAARRLVPRLVVREGRVLEPTNRLLRDVVQARELLTH